MIMRNLGLVAYAEALDIQEKCVARVREEGAETLLLLEHAPVYTVGSGGDLANVLDPGVQALRVNRGGDVTYHGPGQLVGYPLIDLARRGKDLHRYLRFLEEFLIELCAELSVGSFSIPGRTGVWTERGKIASIGVGVRRWVSMHGFCLNVGADTSAFDRINPCGMPGCRITSLTGERGEALSVHAVQELVRERFPLHLERRLPRC